MQAQWEKEPSLEQLRHAYSLLQEKPTQALEELEELADRGSVMSMVYIANAYRSGRGVGKDIPRAKQWYDKASSHGSTLAAYELGRIHLSAKEYEQAAEAFRKGEAEGYAPAIHMLGMLYLRGQGTSRNLIRARELLERAAASGHVFAKRNLGVLLMRGGLGRLTAIRGFWLFISALKDAVILVFSDRLSDRLR